MSKILEIDGVKVIDAKRPLTLIVTKDDVRKADVKKPDNCAVALACRRQFGATEARVHLSRVYLRTNGGKWMRYVTPRDMRSEIIAFDRGGAFETGEFRLMKVQASKLLGKRSGGTAPYTKRGKKRKAPHVVANVRTGPA